MRDITDRKRVEDLLQLSEERYRTMVDSIGEGIGFVNTEEQFEFANRAAERIFGVGPGELVGIKLDQLLPVDQYNLIQKETDKRVQGDNSIYEFEIIRPDGEKRTVLITAVAKTDQEGRFLGTYGVFSDITERKKTETELQNLNLAIYNTQEVVFMTDTEGTINYINPEFTKMYGYTAEEVVGKVTPRILNSGIYNKEYFKAFWDTLFTKQGIPKSEYLNKHKDGKLIHVEGSANPILDNNGDIIGFLGIQKDITQRKQAEEELRLIKAKLDLALQSSGMGVWQYNIIENKRDFDNQSCSLLGIDPGKFRGSAEEFFALVHPDDQKKVSVALKKNHRTACSIPVGVSGYLDGWQYSLHLSPGQVID
jgi:PAS domain S-box-containing protein